MLVDVSVDGWIAALVLITICFTGRVYLAIGVGSSPEWDGAAGCVYGLWRRREHWKVISENHGKER